MAGKVSTARTGAGFLARMRLRHKLALLLSLVALLPVAIAATVAVSVVLKSLENGIRDQTLRQLRIAMGLVLRNVERLGQDVVELSSNPALEAALGGGGADVSEYLARVAPHLPSALVQITDTSGTVIAERAIGGRERYARLSVDASSESVKRGLAYERRVTITPVGELLVVRAVAPIVDASFALRGVLVMSLPLDGDFADGIKGALGSDVLIHAGARPAMSSLLDVEGARSLVISPPPTVAGGVLGGATLITRAVVSGRELQLGYAPLKNLDGDRVGMLGVAVGRDTLVDAKRVAARSLSYGALGAFAFALVLAGILSRQLTRPLARLHEGALAVARGDLNVERITGAPEVDDSGDEIAGLAGAFRTMTESLRQNQENLAQRMREIVAIHDAGHAVSSVLGLEDVLHKIVDCAAGVLDTRLAALWLVEAKADGEQVLKIGAARASRVRTDTDGPAGALTDPLESARLAAPLLAVASVVARTRSLLRIDRAPIGSVAESRELSGSLLAVPLERKGHVVGVLVVGRGLLATAFSKSDESLIGTFADQGATAIENARLYEEVRAFNEALEEKVRTRTLELTTANAELERALLELKETQGKLILSERMAGLGVLVSGIAHEINSPSAAIRGSADALSENVERLARAARELGELAMPSATRKDFLGQVDEFAPRLAEKHVPSPLEVRKEAQKLALELCERGISDAEVLARALAELAACELGRKWAPMFELYPGAILVGYLKEYAYLYRNTAAIQRAIRQIQRIVGALKSYSHLDQAKIELADLHEGIENTLIILHHELKYGINIVRKFGTLPRVPVYVDELNQVWTNLIHNAVQALGGKGEITIETVPPLTLTAEKSIAVKIIDNGPGIPAEILPRIFEPFFTTKANGEGTGLGLGIVEKIVHKHGGSVNVESQPGCTCFTVSLPTIREESQEP